MAWMREDGPPQRPTVHPPGWTGIRMALGFGVFAVAVTFFSAVVLLIWRYEFLKIEDRVRERDEKIEEMIERVNGADRAMREAEGRAEVAERSFEGMRKGLDVQQRNWEDERKRHGQESAALNAKLRAAEEEVAKLKAAAGASISVMDLSSMPVRSEGDPVDFRGMTLRREPEIRLSRGNGAADLPTAPLKASAASVIDASGVKLADKDYLGQVEIDVITHVERTPQGDVHAAVVTVALVQPMVTPMLKEVRWSLTAAETAVEQATSAADLERQVTQRVTELTGRVIAQVAPGRP